MKHKILDPNGRRLQGLTLVELLVVVAIIAILAALILPTLGRAKNSASKITDINNLRQIMIGVQTFVADNNDVPPQPNWDNGGHINNYGDFTNAGWLYTPDLTATGTNRFKAETGVLWSSLGNSKLYVCPMDKPHQAVYSAHDGQVEQRAQQLSSYAMNGAVVGFMKILPTPVRLSSLRPDDCAFWETDETEPYYFNDGANNPGEGVSGRHLQGAIQASFGGTVDYVRFDKWYADESDPKKNRLWCYPNSDNGR
jgi:prepilin-type N-terminal cleavage/methylation domain-containing protein